MDGEITAKITCGLCGVEMQDCEHRGVGHHVEECSKRDEKTPMKEFLDNYVCPFPND